MSWSKAFRLLSLPDGTTTEDSREYARAWKELGDFLEDMFPGYRVFGYDPGISLSHPEVHYKSMVISTHAALALRERVRAMRESDRDLSRGGATPAQARTRRRKRERDG